MADDAAVPQSAERDGDLVILSHRGPVRFVSGQWVPSSGGLVTALDPLLRLQRGLWVSAADTDDPAQPLPELGYRQRLVELPAEKHAGFYGAFSNGVLWPTLHGFPSLGRVDEAPWRDYEDANRAFAESALEDASNDDVVWIHDYHLMRAPLLLRNTQPTARIAWFCHIPWPDVDQFATLPWRTDLTLGVLGAGVVGFHTRKYAQHFLDCVEEFTDIAVDRATSTVEGPNTRVQVVVAPVGIPSEEIRRRVESEEVARRAQALREAVSGRRIVLGVDRLDYTKGIPERLAAFDRLLERYPAFRDELVLIQIVVPSRETVDAYRELKESLDRTVGQINGKHSRSGRVPIHYIYGGLAADDLYAHYVAADVALVTPLRDGMNLVALEYVASRSNEDGALVLSEFAGAAEHLTRAYLVNPYDTDGVASAIARALDDPAHERRARMRALRAAVAPLDVHNWANQFLRRLQAASVAPEHDEPGRELWEETRP